MTEQARKRAQRLLDAQVEFLIADLSGERFHALAVQEVDAALADAERLTLNQVVSRDQIKAVVRKYMVLMQIHGSIPELMGEIAERLYGHPAHDANRIGDVIAQKHVAASVGKALGMKALRQGLFERMAENPLAITWLSWLLYRTATDMRDRIEHLPGVSLVLGNALDALGRVAPGAGNEFDLRLRELSERGARILLGHAERASTGQTDQAPLFDAVMDLYDDHAAEPIGVFRQFLSREDLEDVLVGVYEFWLDFRDTPYLQALVDEGIDIFFDKYGPSTLRDLLEEMGVYRDDLVEEALRFGPPVIDVLRENGMLAATFRRRLEPFFFSDEVLAALE
jgi:hypothetical protein